MALSIQNQIENKILIHGQGSIVVGKRSIKLKKTTPKNLAAKGKISGLVIQALRVIGKDNVTSEQLEIIKKQIEKEKRENIVHDGQLAPAWIAKIMLNN